MLEAPNLSSHIVAPFAPALLADDPATVCAVTKELRISYVNHAWSRFARDNGARWRDGEWGVGALVLDAVPEILRPFYERLFETALMHREVVEHDYECSSAATFRRFRMRILPCDSGLVVVHSLREEWPRSTAGATALDSRYRGLGGIFSQCCHCRRIQRAGEQGSWDWVPEYIERPPSAISHGLCRICAGYYYPEDGNHDG